MNVSTRRGAGGNCKMENWWTSTSDPRGRWPREMKINRRDWMFSVLGKERGTNTLWPIQLAAMGSPQPQPEETEMIYGSCCGVMAVAMKKLLKESPVTGYSFLHDDSVLTESFESLIIENYYYWRNAGTQCNAGWWKGVDSWNVKNIYLHNTRLADSTALCDNKLL